MKSVSSTFRPSSARWTRVIALTTLIQLTRAVYVNYAAQCSATASSRQHPYDDPARVTNGYFQNTTDDPWGKKGDGTVYGFATKIESSPWLEVDLGTPVNVDIVQLYQRLSQEDGRQDALIPLQILVGNKTNPKDTCGIITNATRPRKNPLNVYCRPRIKGRYVRLILDGRTVDLQLNEMKVIMDTDRYENNTTDYTPFPFHVVNYEEYEKLQDKAKKIDTENKKQLEAKCDGLCIFFIIISILLVIFIVFLAIMILTVADEDEDEEDNENMKWWTTNFDHISRKAKWEALESIYGDE